MERANPSPREEAVLMPCRLPPPGRRAPAAPSRLFTPRLLILGAFFLLLLFLPGGPPARASGGAESVSPPFPPPLESYGDSQLGSLSAILGNRIRKQPFNLVATLLFLGAVLHTGLTSRFRHAAHALEERHRARRLAAEAAGRPDSIPRVSGWGRLLHFFGEVETVFGIWAIPLLVAMSFMVGRPAGEGYFNHRLDFTEAAFVIVVMSVASTRPILRLAEGLLGLLARAGGGSLSAWWISILTVGPLLGSFITEPAAMTICALLLSRRFYALGPGPKLAYATLGLLFVSISTGGTLTDFAAPPVLMVARPWAWDTPFMLIQFGWKALVGILISTGVYFLVFRKELLRLGSQRARADEPPEEPIPVWVTLGHLAFLVLAVLCAHYVVYLVMIFLFFLAFVEVTEEFQREFSIRPPVLVGFFLAGLVVHGGLQQWWIAPLLGSLRETSLMLGAVALTAFNDNAAITYLCTLVPSFTDGMKYAAVAGAVAGGGLTVIANAPNPAGQSILQRHFRNGVGMAALLAGALFPTVVQVAVFLLFRP
jgi:putative Na+/H+ antiporter